MFEALVAEVDSVEVGALSRGRLCDLTAGVARIRAAVDALEARATAAIDGLGDAGPGAATVLRSVGRCSQREADRRARRAKALAEMPRTAEALRSGAINVEHADALVRAAEATSPVEVEESSLVDTMSTRPADLAARDARDWTQSHQTATSVEERHRRQRAARRLAIFDGDNGMTVLHAEFDPVTGAQLRAVIDSETTRLFETDGGRGRADETRTSEQRRADALASLLGATSSPGGCGGESAPPAPRRSVTPRNQIVVVAHSEVITGADPHGRCEIPGTGPIPRSELERLACDADLFGILFSGRGEPLWAGREHRTVTPTQWRALVARDRGCMLCGTSPSRCEAHHIIPWLPQNGPTDIDNLVLLCSRHHHELHDSHATLEQTDGTWQMLPRAGPSRLVSVRGDPPRVAPDRPHESP